MAMTITRISEPCLDCGAIGRMVGWDDIPEDGPWETTVWRREPRCYSESACLRRQRHRERGEDRT